MTESAARPALAPLVERFSELTVLVVGEPILDVWLRGRSTRLCREGPAPLVDLVERVAAPGGAANAAANVASLGARATFLSAVGDDEAGAALRRLLHEAGVGTAHLLTAPGRRTLVKHRVVSDAQVLVRFDEGDTGQLGELLQRRMAGLAEDLLDQHDAVLVSDYGYGVVGPALRECLRRRQRAAPLVLVCDAKHPERYQDAGVTAIKPNYHEAVRLLGLEPLDGSQQRAQQIEREGGRIRERLGARMVAVTLDADGALLFDGEAPPYRTYARPRPAAFTTGAGDTFASALTLALAAGGGGHAAAELASAAAALAVTRDGTAVCSQAALREAVAGERQVVSSLADLRTRVELYRQQGRRVVFTNGCFDILHRGHIAYLNQAKALGDALVVGINSDASVRRLKGPDRPVNPLEDRLAVLAALSCIDVLVPFDEDTPAALLEVVRPDVFVKGGDYRRETLPEASLVESLGGEVRILPYVPDRSTSDVIRRIRAGGQRLAASGEGGGR